MIIILEKNMAFILPGGKFVVTEAEEETAAQLCMLMTPRLRFVWPEQEVSFRA